MEQNKDKSEKSKNLKEIERMKRNIEGLKQEKKNLLKESTKIHTFLKSRKDQLIEKLDFDIKKFLPFVQFCLLPRIKLSSADSIFCVKFIEFLHTIKGSTFSSQINLAFDLVSSLIPTLQSLSENEAYNMGVFFKEILEVSQNWNDEMKFYNDIQAANDKSTDKEKVSTNKMKALVLANDDKITARLVELLKCENFILMRNIVIILNRLITVYPATKGGASKILDAFEARFNEEGNNKSSLYYQATSYKVQLSAQKALLPSTDHKRNKIFTENYSNIFRL